MIISTTPNNILVPSLGKSTNTKAINTKLLLSIKSSSTIKFPASRVKEKSILSFQKF